MHKILLLSRLLDWQSCVIVDKASAMNTLHKISHVMSSSTISICFVNYAYLASCVCDDIPKARYYHEYANLVQMSIARRWRFLKYFWDIQRVVVNSNANTYQLDPTQKMRLFLIRLAMLIFSWAKCMCRFKDY